MGLQRQERGAGGVLRQRIGDPQVVFHSLLATLLWCHFIDLQIVVAHAIQVVAAGGACIIQSIV